MDVSLRVRRPDCVRQVEPRFCCTHGPLYMYIILCSYVVYSTSNGWYKVLELTCMCTFMMFMHGVDDDNCTLTYSINGLCKRVSLCYFYIAGFMLSYTAEKRSTQFLLGILIFVGYPIQLYRGTTFI
jgi:hypothetical protein